MRKSNTGNYNPFVIIQGKVHHAVAANLIPEEGVQPAFAQLYILDEQLANQQRVSMLEPHTRVSDKY